MPYGNHRTTVKSRHTHLSEAFDEPEDGERSRSHVRHGRRHQCENGSGQYAEAHGVFSAKFLRQNAAGQVRDDVTVVEGRQQLALRLLVPVEPIGGVIRIGLVRRPVGPVTLLRRRRRHRTVFVFHGRHRRALHDHRLHHLRERYAQAGPHHVGHRHARHTHHCHHPSLGYVPCAETRRVSFTKS